MIKRTDLLSFPFYKKDKFTGSFKGMRYLIRKADGEGEDIFEVFTWPGPYNFASTDESKKARKTFPFEPDSLDTITQYLNDTYESGKNNWHTSI